MQNEWWKLVFFGTLFFFWVLSQIKSKDVGPVADRVSGPDPRPGGLPPAPRTGARDAFGRPPGASPNRTGPRRADQDEIIVIRGDQTRPGARPGAGTKRQTRSRPAPPPVPSRRPEPSRARPLPTGVTQKLDASFDVKPLMSGPSLLASAPAEPAKIVAPAPGPNAAEVRETLRSPQRLREAFLLNELLQPPLSLRPRRRG